MTSKSSKVSILASLWGGKFHRFQLSIFMQCLIIKSTHWLKQAKLDQAPQLQKSHSWQANKTKSLVIPEGGNGWGLHIPMLRHDLLRYLELKCSGDQVLNGLWFQGWFQLVSCNQTALLVAWDLFLFLWGQYGNYFCGTLLSGQWWGKLDPSFRLGSFLRFFWNFWECTCLHTSHQLMK